MPGLGDFGFSEPWEAKYAQGASEMIERGDYLTPRYRDEVHLSEPILVYWGILVGTWVFGPTEFGARVPGVCAALAAMLVVYYAVSILRGRRTGLLAALVLVTLPQFYYLSRQALPEIYLSASLGSCLLLLCLGMFGPERRRTRHLVAAYACLALAILAKGPLIGAGIVLSTLAIFALTRAGMHPLLASDNRLGFFGCLVTSVLGLTLAGGAAVAALVSSASPQQWRYEETRLGAERISEALDSVIGPSGVMWVSVLGIAVGVALVVGSVAWFLSRPAVDERIGRSIGSFRRQAALCVAVVGIIAGPWHLVILLRTGPLYLVEHIVEQNIYPILFVVESRGAVDFFIRATIFGFFPWSCLLPVALAALIDWQVPKPFLRQGPEILLVIACCVTFAGSALSSTKFSHHLSPIVLPVAVLVGLTAHATLTWRGSAAACAWICAAMLFLTASLDLLRLDGIKYFVGALTPAREVPTALHPGPFVAVLLFGILLLMLALAVFRSRLLIAGLVLLGTLFALHQSTAFLPRLGRFKTVKGLANVFNELRIPGARVAVHGDGGGGVDYYFRADPGPQVIDDLSDLARFIRPDRPNFGVIRQADLNDLIEAHQEAYPGFNLTPVAGGPDFTHTLLTSSPVDPRPTGESDR